MVKQWKLKIVAQQINGWKNNIQFLCTSHSFSYDRNPYSLSTLKKNVSVFYDFVLFRILCSIVYAISCVFLCLPLSSVFCVEKYLLCSSERCFVYYLKIQATESFEISQNSVHMNIVTNILPLSITIFMFSLLQSFDHFRPELHANFRVFFEKSTAVRYGLLDNFHSEHPVYFKFLSFWRLCMFLYAGRS
jgi:hypothetical protein